MVEKCGDAHEGSKASKLPQILTRMALDEASLSGGRRVQLAHYDPGQEVVPCGWERSERSRGLGPSSTSTT